MVRTPLASQTQPLAFQPTYPVTVIAIIDWMVYAVDASGRLLQTWTEQWPDWGHTERRREHMDVHDWHSTLLHLLRSKRPVWGDVKALYGDDPYLETLLSDIRATSAMQADFINRWR